MHRSLLLFLTGAVLLTACDGSEPAAPVTPEVPAPPSEIDPAALKADAAEPNLVPSPRETLAALKNTGIKSSLPDAATLLEKLDKDAKAGVTAERDAMAIKSGVVLADMVMTADSSTDEQLVAQLDHLNRYLTDLKGNADLTATLDQLKERVQAGQFEDRSVLVDEMDQLAQVVRMEATFESDDHDRIAPLILAGMWLEGTHMVAVSALASERPDAAAALLKEPQVVGYFKEHTAKRADEDNDPVYEQLSKSLAELEALANQEEPYTDKEITQIEQLTSSLLSLI